MRLSSEPYNPEHFASAGGKSSVCGTCHTDCIPQSSQNFTEVSRGEISYRFPPGPEWRMEPIKPGALLDAIQLVNQTGAGVAQ